MLAEVIEQQDLKGKKCLDMGCGSGLLAVFMAKQGAIVTAADINLDAVKMARENSINNQAEVYAVFSNLFSNIMEKFDLIVFNPPYLPGDDKEKSEITYYGGKGGREVIGKFLQQAKNFLKKNGKILFLISTVTGENEVKEIAWERGYKIKDVKRKKVPWEELIILELETR